MIDHINSTETISTTESTLKTDLKEAQLLKQGLK